MRDEHILDILETGSLSSLSERDLGNIRAHTIQCADCLRAYNAAKISTLLLKERASQAIEPSPFFHTRVMAAIRERQGANEPSAIVRMWKAAGALFSTMTAAVAVLAVAAFLAPTTRQNFGSQEVATIYDPYSAERVLLNRDEMSGEELNYAEVLTTIYDSEEDAAR